MSSHNPRGPSLDSPIERRHSSVRWNWVPRVGEEGEGGVFRVGEIRIAVVGLGHRGLGWCQLLEQVPGFRIVALCDPIVALHERALARLKQPNQVKTYQVYEDVLADPGVDAIA